MRCVNSTHSTTYWRKLVVKVKQFPYRPGQTLRVPEGSGTQVSKQSTHEACQPCALIAFTPQEVFLVLLESDTIPEAWRPVTFRLVAQCLNQLLHRVPLIFISMNSLLRHMTPSGLEK